MKYAHEVIDLLAAYPGRRFVMRQIVLYVNPRAGCQERVAVKKAVQRVLVALAATGSVTITPQEMLGGQARYAWKTGT
ncbi:MAG TPA: hypothetical protein PK752_08210 [Accumulibacter sp.]|uniref:hypothetical protein n=1 Tax=Accumulibacter sp. TaxID=2053492 RepID=UPI002C97F8D4|nr:hypothetical protein [Accumulibacter sp.]HRD88233.1 hypothetical protein [Accumulibacter sp.]